MYISRLDKIIKAHVVNRILLGSIQIALQVLLVLVSNWLMNGLSSSFELSVKKGRRTSVILQIYIYIYVCVCVCVRVCVCVCVCVRVCALAFCIDVIYIYIYIYIYNIFSTENDIDMRIAKAWIANDRLSGYRSYGSHIYPIK